MLTQAIVASGDAFAPVSIDFPSSSPPRWSLSGSLGTDTPTATMTWWEKPDTSLSASSAYVIGNSSSSRSVTAFNANDGGVREVRAPTYDDASNIAFITSANRPPLVRSEWNCVLLSVNISTFDYNIAIVNSSGVTTVTGVQSSVGSPTSISFSEATTTIIGALNSSGTSPYFGQLAEITVYRDAGLIDFSSAANRRKFITEDGAGGIPVSLGADGSTPFGTQPLIYMTGSDVASWNNVGAAGSFILTGTASAGTTPAIPSP